MSGNPFQDFRYGVGKLLYATPIYRYTLVGRAPTELAVVPPDSWPGNAERAARFPLANYRSWAKPSAAGNTPGTRSG